MRLHRIVEKRGLRAPRNLRTRGDALHTFGTLLAPLAMGLVAAGFYVLGSAFLHPLTADSASVLVAALALALGFVLLSYLLRSAMASQPSRRAPRVRQSVFKGSPSKMPQPVSSAKTESQMQLPSHRTYVDRARILR